MSGRGIAFTGELSDADLAREYQEARALLFPGEEDFGIVPVECQMSGRPVIALGRGGALEAVRGIWSGSPWTSGATGIFFEKQSAESLAEAILAFENVEDRFSVENIRAHTRQFEKPRFQAEFQNFVADRLSKFEPRRAVASIAVSI